MCCIVGAEPPTKMAPLSAFGIAFPVCVSCDERGRDRCAGVRGHVRSYSVSALQHTCVQGTRSAESAGTKEPCSKFGSYKRQQAPGSSGERNSEVSQPLRRSPTAKIKCFVNPHKDVGFSCSPVCSVHPHRPRSWPPTRMKASGEKQAEANQAATNIHHITGWAEVHLHLVRLRPFCHCPAFLPLFFQKYLIFFPPTSTK